MGQVELINMQVLKAGQYDEWLPLQSDGKLKEKKVQGELHLVAQELHTAAN